MKSLRERIEKLQLRGDSSSENIQNFQEDVLTELDKTIAKIEKIKKKNKEWACLCKIPDMRLGFIAYPKEGDCPFCTAINKVLKALDSRRAGE